MPALQADAVRAGERDVLVRRAEVRLRDVGRGDVRDPVSHGHREHDHVRRHDHGEAGQGPHGDPPPCGAVAPAPPPEADGAEDDQGGAGDQRRRAGLVVARGCARRDVVRRLHAHQEADHAEARGKRGAGARAGAPLRPDERRDHGDRHEPGGQVVRRRGARAWAQPGVVSHVQRDHRRRGDDGRPTGSAEAVPEGAAVRGHQ